MVQKERAGDAVDYRDTKSKDVQPRQPRRHPTTSMHYQACDVAPLLMGGPYLRVNDHLDFLCWKPKAYGRLGINWQIPGRSKDNMIFKEPFYSCIYRS